MAKMNTSHRYLYDAAPATLFRARSEATQSGTTYLTNTVVLDKIEGYWNVNNELADETVAIVINVTAKNPGLVDFSVKGMDAANQELALSLGFISVEDMSQYVFLLDIPTIQKLNPDLAGLALQINNGTGSRLGFHAWLSQIKKA